MVKKVSTIRELRIAMETWRRREETIGFIPTMGALHEGHRALIRQAQSLSTRLVVSVFVNPLQFGPNENYATYPRTIEDDIKLLDEMGCDLLFTPSVEDVYPFGFATTISPGPVGAILEGHNRPGHFAGVATVMTKLLLQVMPDYVFLGEKNYQQYRIVEQLVSDLHIPVGIVPVPVSRDENDLPFSTDWRFLLPEEKERASLFPKIMTTAVEDIRVGHDIEATLLGGAEQLTEAGFVVDYFDLVDSRSLETVRTLRKPTRLLSAVTLGKARLVDNMAV